MRNIIEIILEKRQEKAKQRFAYIVAKNLQHITTIKCIATKIAELQQTEKF